MVSTCLKASARIEASPGPYRAEPSLFRHGAAYIEDANGEIVGWATDTAGHTTEDVAADRRDPRQTLLNAHMMALGPQALGVLLVFMDAIPAAIERLRAAAQPSAELSYAEYEGGKVLAQLRAARLRAEARVAI